MTERIYYRDSYCRAFAAVVMRAVEHEGRPAVILDRTAFYPTSGGQPFDTGRLGDVEVLDVIDVNDEILHVLSAPLAEGTGVRGEIDWPRRFDHMQQHTGQHLLSAAFDRLFDNRTMSFHLGAEVSTIDLAREVGASDIEHAIDETNRVIWEDRSISVRIASAEEAATLQLRKEPVRQGPLRIVEVRDFDVSACGGTHVERTGAVGVVAALGTERFRGGTRVTFVCGGRAVRQLRTYRDAIAGSVRALSVLPPELPGAVEKLQAEARELRKTIKALQEQLATYEAARLVAAAPETGGTRVIVEALEGWDAAGLKAIAAAATISGRVAVVLLSRDAIVVARSGEMNVDANAVLRQLAQRFGGKGGGKPDLAQGGGLKGSLEEIASVARELVQSVIRTQGPPSGGHAG
jgi:alanyl-tRNA synthetase